MLGGDRRAVKVIAMIAILKKKKGGKTLTENKNALKKDKKIRHQHKATK